MATAKGREWITAHMSNGCLSQSAATLVRGLVIRVRLDDDVVVDESDSLCSGRLFVVAAAAIRCGRYTGSS